MKNDHHIAFDDIVCSLEKNQNKIALIDREGKKYTYSQFKQNITGARAHLKQLGVKKGSKVLVFITMSMELYAVLEAMFSLGATTIFLDPWMKGRKMGAIIRNIKPDFLVLNKKAAKYSWLLPATWKLSTWKINQIPVNNDSWEIENVKDDDSALITYTSGSTGIPKGANRTFSFIDAQAKALKEKLIGDKQFDNIDYTNLPIVALAGFALGNTIIIPRINLMQVDQADPEEIMSHLNETNVNRLVVSPSLLKKILIGIKKSGKGQIKKIVTGGSPISSELIKDCIENHPNIEFESIYGSTEAEPISAASMKSIYKKLDEPLKGVYVGEHEQNIKLRIIAHTSDIITNDYFDQGQLAKGKIGEIVISGNHVNKSYYYNEGAFERYKVVDKEGNTWHRTGDIGYLEGNSIFLVGRENRIMQQNGSKYYPFPIEQLIEDSHGLTDIGYIQNKNGAFILYIGSGQEVDKKILMNSIEAANYPIDRVEFRKAPLPRDPRHRSKLQTEKLI